MSKEKIILLLGGIAHEGITSYLRLNNINYQNKILHSTVENWKRICEIFNEYEVIAVIGKITTHTCAYIIDNEYKNTSKILFENISKIPHALYLFQGIITGEEEIYDGNNEEPYCTNMPEEEILKNVELFFAEYNLNIVPYITSAEITISVQNFIEEIHSGLLFKIYVPQGKFWEDEIDKLLKLFKDYLSTVEHLDVRLQHNSTSNGSIYCLYKTDKKNNENLSKEFDEFTTFINLCNISDNKCELFLKTKNIKEQNIITILNKYKKEAKRLFLDLKHTRESKLLSIHQNLESELLDNLDIEEFNYVMNHIKDKIPSITGIDSNNILASNYSNDLTPPSNVTYNINPQIINTVNGIVSREVNGNIQYNNNDKQILDLIEKYSKTNGELISALNEIKDKGLNKSQKISSFEKLKKFLFKVADKLGDASISVLTKYIESQLM